MVALEILWQITKAKLKSSLVKCTDKKCFNCCEETERGIPKNISFLGIVLKTKGITNVWILNRMSDWLEDFNSIYPVQDYIMPIY